MAQEYDRQRMVREFLRKIQVADLKQLCRALKTKSRMTVFRALNAEGYLTSYSHAGKFYTLDGVPRFEASGLWFWRDIGFSKHGTLGASIVALIKESTAGYTHEELQALMQLRVHDTLLDLIHNGLISRVQIEDFVYFDAELALAKNQLLKRRAMLKHVPERPLDLAAVIEILLIVIRRQTNGAPQIGAMLRAKGLRVTDDQVSEVLTQYGLGKKTKKSPFRRSRR